MANETTPLKSPDQDEEEYYFEEEEQSSTSFQYIMIGLGSLFGLVCMYLFAFYLPLLYIPKSTDIKGIVKVVDSQFDLIPLTSARVKELGLHKFRTLNDDDDDDDADLMEEHDEFGKDHKYDVNQDEDEDEEEDEWSLISPSKSSPIERLIMIGDIHGEFKHLMKLVKKIRFNPNKDKLIFLGDFISKGPDSTKVLDWAISNKIECVLGNHELYVLQNYARFHNLDTPWFVSANSTTTVPERFVSITDKFNDDPEFLLAKKLQPEHVEYINSCPVIKKLGKVPFHKPELNNGTFKAIEGVAVHAGLRWDLYDQLEEQNPLSCLEMRKLVPPFYNETTDDPHFPGAIGWTGKWKEQSNLLPRKKRLGIYYGHDARKGLRLKKYTRGLDSRCNAGGHLTAMVLWREEEVVGKKTRTVYKEQGFQVKC